MTTSSSDEARSAGLNPVPDGVVSLDDYERQARACMAHDAYEYFASGAGDEVTLARNRAAFGNFEILPRVLGNLSAGSTALTLLGKKLRHPILLGPVAHQGLAHPDGELAVVQAAAAAEAGMVVSTLASRSLEALAGGTHQSLWFQLYFQPSRDATLALVRRAEAAGYKALVLTVDAPVNGVRNRIQRAGFSVPEHARAVNLDGVQAPAPTYLSPGDSVVFQGLMAEAPQWSDVQWLIAQTALPVLLKGILDPRDALLASEAGAAGVIVSNHGGRCLDMVPASIDALPAIRDALGESFPVLLDGGVRRGTDVFIALARGADAVLLGRAQVFALAVAGAVGVAHMLRILRDELEIAMALAGCPTVAHIRRDAVVSKRR